MTLVHKGIAINVTTHTKKYKHYFEGEHFQRWLCSLKAWLIYHVSGLYIIATFIHGITDVIFEIQDNSDP